MTEVKLKDLIAPSFYGLYRDVKRHGHTHYWLSGGRGSTKSSFVSLAIPLGMMAHPERNAVVSAAMARTCAIVFSPRSSGLSMCLASCISGTSRRARCR